MNTVAPERPALPKVPEFTPRIHLIILTLTTLVLLMSGSFQLPITMDEPRFSQATREMMERHEWIIPYFNGEFRLDKPPFIYWTMMAFYSLFGTHEICARLPGILSTLLLILATYQIGRRFFTPTIGFCAAFGLATCLQILIHGRLAVADMPMILGLTISQAMLMVIILPREEKRSWTDFWLFYLAQVLGFLAKGPVVQIITLLTLLIFRFALWRKPLPWKRLRLELGIPLMLGLIGIWGIPALIQTHGQWWNTGIGENVLNRGIEPFNGRSHFILYYFLTSIFSLCPWFALVGYGWLVLRQNWNATNAFLGSWILATYLLFTLYATQLPHYVMPAFPAFFLLLGQIVTLRPKQPAWASHVRLGIGSLYLILALLILTLSLVIGEQLRPLFWGLMLLFLGLFALLQAFQREWWRLIVLEILIIASGWFFIGSTLQKLAPSISIAQIASSLPAEAPCTARGFSEASLVFYTDRHWQLDQSFPALQQALNHTGPGLVIELEEELSIGPSFRWLIQKMVHQPVAPLHGKDYSDEISQLSAEGWKTQEVTGLNLGRSSWVRLKVYSR